MALETMAVEWVPWEVVPALAEDLGFDVPEEGLEPWTAPDEGLERPRLKLGRQWMERGEGEREDGPGGIRTGHDRLGRIVRCRPRLVLSSITR